MNQTIAIGFAVYLLLILVVGIVTARYNKTLPDFFLVGPAAGGHGIVALSERASGQSGWLILGLTGLAYATGLGDPSGTKSQPALWASIGGCSGVALSWILIAEKLRKETEQLGALTLPRYFELKFRGHDLAIRFVTTAIIVFCFIFYIAAQFDAAGKISGTNIWISAFYRHIAGGVHNGFLHFNGWFFRCCMDRFFSRNHYAGNTGCSAFGGFGPNWRYRRSGR